MGVVIPAHALADGLDGVGRRAPHLIRGLQDVASIELILGLAEQVAADFLVPPGRRRFEMVGHIVCSPQLSIAQGEAIAGQVLLVILHSAGPELVEGPSVRGSTSSP